MNQGLHAGLLARLEVKVKLSNGTEGSFTVRGLNPTDVVGVVQRCGPKLAPLFDSLVKDNQVSLDRAESVVGSLFTEAPDVAATIIAAAAGPVTDDAVAIATQLPGPVQLDALEKVARLTFTSDMPPKKVLEVVVTALGGLSSAVKAAALPA